MTLFQEAAEWLGERLKDAAGRTVTISRRGAVIDSGITAPVAFQEYQLADDQGGTTIVPVYDWTFTAADLAQDLRKGDRISETLNGSTVTYEVLPVGNGPCIVPLDSSGLLILVHSKKVDG